MGDVTIVQDEAQQASFYVGNEPPVRLADDQVEQLKQLTTDYRATLRTAVSTSQAELTLREIGEALFAWLQDCGNWGQRLVSAAGPGKLEFHLHPAHFEPGQLGEVVAAAPWELLANNDGFLARRLNSQFLVVRRLLNGQGVYDPSDHRLSLVFMAASPHGQPELAYRREEVAIATSAGRVGIDLTVEETGQIEQLAEALTFLKQDVAPADVFHLSCHGSNDPLPAVALESETGQLDLVDAAKLWNETRHGGYKLAFVSACHTAEASGTAPSFARQLVGFGLPAAVAWDGAVSDQEAILFAEQLYRQLNRGDTLEQAYLAARNVLASQESRDWHLCRLLLAEQAGGPLTSGTKARVNTVQNQAEAAFLDSERKIPIAGFTEFVGRRRELQDSIRTFRNGQMLLLHGPGNMGKSSLAGRLARRFPNHRHVVCYGTTCDPRSLLTAIRDACRQADLSALIEEKLQQLKDDPGLFRDLLVEVLQQAEAIDTPILLILDDLEQVLQDEPPKEGLHSVDPAYVDAIGRALQAFQHHDGGSRLLITCRYEFQLPQVYGNVLDSLHPVQLFPFKAVDHQRQLAQLRYNLPAAQMIDANQQALLERSCELASGNPGLLRLLVDVVVSDAEAAIGLLGEVEAYLGQGNDPTHSGVSDYLEDLAVDAKLGALSETEARALQISILLQLPVYHEVYASLVGQLWNCDGEQVGRRLSSFGLWDRVPDLIDPSRDAYAVNQLARPRIDPPSDEEAQSYAEQLLPVLSEAWPFDKCSAICDVQLCQLASLTDDSETFAQRGESALAYLDNNNQYREGYRLAKLAFERVAEPSPNTSRLIAKHISANALSHDEVQQCHQLYSQAIAGLPEPTDAPSAIELGGLLRDRANLSRTLGDIDTALEDYQASLRHLEKHRLTRERAIMLGDIARIKVARGDVDAALELHQERLRVFESLGDLRSRAIALGDIAQIKVARGDVDAALELHQEELSVYESLGDLRSRAITLGDIARIKVARGDVDAALELHQERLRVFESLGDLRSRAITLGDIARIKFARGDVDAALELQQEMLRVFESLGDLRERAITLGDIARIKVARGDVDAALELHQEMLRVFESLGDLRSRAVTLGEIARIKVARGDVDAALELQQERLATARQLDDHDSIAAAQNDLFDLLWQKERHQDAVEAISEAYSLLVKLGRVDGVGVVAMKLGQVLMVAGNPVQAREVLTVARSAWEKLKDQQQIDLVDQLLEKLPPPSDA